MKKLFYSMFLTALSAGACTAGPASVEAAAATTIKVSDSSPLTTILNSYYQLSEALVGGEAKIVSAKAKALSGVLAGVKSTSLSGGEKKAWESYGKQLSTTADKIASTSTIAKQRELFASLSDNMTAFVKAYGVEDVTVYRMYCPMKKVYWLSDQKQIENPYYGKEMLSCGKIVETIK